MQPERWGEVERLYYLALEYEPERRSQLLAESFARDPELTREVESLLNHGHGDSRLERPVWQARQSPLSDLEIGKLGPYEIAESIGAGGMGHVFRAHDTRLRRTVAIKISKEPLSGRFKREARAAAALSHPNIVQVYELGSSEGRDYIVMELVAGQTLARLIAERPLRIDEALSYAQQIASALAAAHAAAVVHRDIKPANILVNDMAQIKVLDFGLAKYEPAEEPGAVSKPTISETASGVGLGTPSYMSPEQAQGRATDARSDVFSFGAVLYEMLTGRRAFAGDSTFAILSSVVNDTPAPANRLRADVPQAIVRLIGKCLEKEPTRRYASGSELEAALAEAARPVPSAARRYSLRIGLVAVPLAIVCFSVWFHFRNERLRWARDDAPPRIQSLVLLNDYFGAFDLTREALKVDPSNPQLKQHWQNVSLPLKMDTEPSGARVSARPFGSAALPWHPVGTTPLEAAPIPNGNLRVRVEKEGFEPREFSAFTVFLMGQKIRLYRKGTVPDGMVPVPANSPPVGPVHVMPLPDYFLDKFEVTNRQFQRFVDQGGYRNRQFWRYPFARNGRAIPWEQAMSEFRDTTGRPGPALWELGAYPKEQPEHPVAGVSWFEASAYCESVGKALPSMYHWQKAAGFGIHADILLFSNFSRDSAMRVGENPGITPFGAYDMAGNVKEWVQNQAGERRLILGGAFGEPGPGGAFSEVDAREPLARQPSFGFRCASYPVPVPAEAFSTPLSAVRDYSIEQPVGDDTFALIQRMYAYDAGPLESKMESVDDSNPLWRKETVSYTAAYGGERITAYLFLPKNVKPPYQTVLLVPGGWAFVMRNSLTSMVTDGFDFLVRTGRAVMYPVYKGTFERHASNGRGPNYERERTIQFVKDAGRSVDYLKTRSDIQSDRLGYYGMSQGASLGPVILALDPRIRAAVLNGVSLESSKVPVEIDNFNFAPRVHAPVLILGGKHDFGAPPAQLQEPLFRWLGTRDADKRFLLFDTGRVGPLRDVMRETLGWMDRYLGPVTAEPNGTGK